MVCDSANENGVSPRELVCVLDLVISHNSLDQTSRGLIIKALFPASTVPSDIVNKVASSLGHGTQKAKAPTQAALVRWLIMVHPLLENPATLSSIYSVLFNMLGRMDIRSPLSHLIAMITKRTHAKPFRLNILRQLARDVPREPALEKLLRIFERLVPVQSGTMATKAPSIVFAHPDPAWGEQLQAIQQRTGGASEAAGLYPRPFTFSFVTKETENGLEPSFKPLKHQTQIVLDMTSIASLASRLEDLDVSGLNAHNLTNHLLRQCLLLRPENEVATQLDDALNPLLQQQLDAVGTGGVVKKIVLEDILAYTRFAKVSHAILVLECLVFNSLGYVTTGGVVSAEIST